MILMVILSSWKNDNVLYFSKMFNGRRTFTQVSTKFKEAVKADLESLGLDENGCPF